MQKINLNSQSFSSVMTLIKKQCCNYYQCNCLLLDDGDSHTCPQRITPSHIICRYFLDTVLPADKVLHRSLISDPTAEMLTCALCRRKTERTGRNQKFCPDCAKIKQRKRNTEYMSAKRSRVDVYGALKPPE